MIEVKENLPRKANYLDEFKDFHCGCGDKCKYQWNVVMKNDGGEEGIMTFCRYPYRSRLYVILSRWNPDFEPMCEIVENEDKS